MVQGHFSGTPHSEWVPASDKADRFMRLLADFSFTDPSGKVWLAPAGYISTVRRFRGPSGALSAPHMSATIDEASVVHDKARDDAADDAARRAADRMFYQACRAGGCSTRQATLLYIGVRTGLWLRLVPAWRGASTNDEGPTLARSAVDASWKRIFA